MSDYGFKTVKTNKNGGKDTAINAKYPMMGFDLSHRPKSFRTIHISDIKTNPFASSSTPGYSSPTLPSVSSLSNLPVAFVAPDGTRWYITGGANKTYGYVREEIYRYEHGYDFRPACYGTIIGVLNRRVRTNAIGNESGTSPVGKYYYNGSIANSNWNLMTSFNTVSESTSIGYPLFPWMNGMKTSYGENLNHHMFSYTLSDAPSTSTNNTAIKDSMRYLTIRNYNYSDVSSNAYYPYDFEVDEKYVKIYRTYYWCEIYGRIYFDHTFYDDDMNYRYEMKDFLRTKFVEQLNGSEIDITIMLFPYRMEDLR